MAKVSNPANRLGVPALSAGLAAEDCAVLQCNPLFSELEPQQLEPALQLLCAEERCYSKNDTVLTMCQTMNKFGLVLSGAVQVAMCDINGQRLLMASVRAGESFGEALHWLRDEQRDCLYIEAVQPSRILWLDAQALREPQSALAQHLAGRLIALLAERTLSMNDRIQVLSKRSLRDKIVTFLTQQSNYCGSDSFSTPLDRAALADYLGCDRAACVYFGEHYDQKLRERLNGIAEIS